MKINQMMSTGISRLQINPRVALLVDCSDLDQKLKTIGICQALLKSYKTDAYSSSDTGSKKRRKLDGEGPGSEDDQDRFDRVDDDDRDVGMEERAETVLDVRLGRHAVPRPSDGQVRSLMS